jgi:hypothetical protein
MISAGGAKLSLKKNFTPLLAYFEELQFTKSLGMALGCCWGVLFIAEKHSTVWAL